MSHASSRTDEEQPKISAAELRAELARRGWQQKVLAQRTGLSPAHISAITLGLRPSRRATALILAALGEEGARRVVLSAE